MVYLPNLNILLRKTDFFKDFRDRQYGGDTHISRLNT